MSGKDNNDFDFLEEDGEDSAPGADFGFGEDGEADGLFEEMPDSPVASGGSVEEPFDDDGFSAPAADEDEDDFRVAEDEPHFDAPVSGGGFDDEDEGIAALGAEEEEDEFGDIVGDDLGGADEDESDAVVAAPAAKSGIGRFVVPAAAVLAVGFVAMLGWPMISPLITSQDATVADAGPAPVYPKPGAVGAQTGAGGIPMPTLPAAGGAVVPVSLPADAPALPVDAPALPMDAPKLPAEAKALDIGAPPPAPSRPAAASPESVGRLAALDDEVKKLRSERSGLAGKIDDLERRLASLEKSVPDTMPAPMVQPPKKPAVVDGWVLKGVLRDVAWISGPSGLRQIRAGDEVPGAGTVRDITKYEDNWVVVTTAGVILQGE